MKFIRYIFGAILIAATLAGGARAGSGAQFLNIGLGAKATAMGESYVAGVGDATAIYWNPAGMSTLDRTQILASHNFWLMDMSLQYLGFVAPTDFGHIGAALTYSSSGSIPRYENFEHVGDYSAYDMAGAVAYSFRLTGEFSLGGSLKFIQQRIDDASALGVAFDVGVHQTFRGSLPIHLGASIRNLGSDMTFIGESDPLPLNYSAGVALDFGAMTMASAICKPRDEEVSLGMGGELFLKETLALRVGYSGLRGMSTGMALSLGGTCFEFSYLPMTDVGSSVTIGMTLDL